jgi:hypothetical protein
VLGSAAGSVAVQPSGIGPVTQIASPPSSNCQSLLVTGGDPCATVGDEYPRQRPVTSTIRPTSALLVNSS